MAKRKVVHVPGDGSYGNGSIRQRGDKWQVRWYESDKRLSSSGFESEAEARDKLASIQRRLADGKPGIEPVSPRVTQTTVVGDKGFAELVGDWTTYRIAHKRRMAEEERTRWDLHLGPRLETQTVRGLTTRWVRELAAELVSPTAGSKTRKVSGPTAHRVLTLLSSFYRWAIREGYADTNPVRPALTDPDLKALLKSKHDKDSMLFLRSWVEVDRLYGAMAQTSVGIWYLLQARAGLRPGEATALRWADVDLATNTITVRANVRHGHLGPTKSGKARLVPIAPKLSAELSRWRQAGNAEGLVCPPPRRKRKDGTLASAMGTHLATKSIDKAFAAAFAATKIKPATAYAYGRHSFGSILGLSAAVSAPRLQAIMGHQDIKTTLRYVSLAGQALTEKELQAFG